MRLDRFLARATGLTRSQARQAIRAGRVRLIEEPLRSAAASVGEDAEVFLDGEPLQLPQFVYLMLHKPQGVVCATRDAEHPTVIDLLPDSITANPKGELHPAGRLDIDTTGLVLITDDGQWSHNLTSPRKDCSKCYRVSLAEPLAAGVAEQFLAGVELKGDAQPTRPAQLAVESPQQVSLTISEGRYHQVKRMFAAVGNRVIALHRHSIGAVTLDPALQPGEWRLLSQTEIDSFMSTARDTQS